jgi:hypothetical protein
MAYTAQQVFDITLGLMIETGTSSTDYKRNYLPILNTILSGCLSRENSLRYRDGMEELTEAPNIQGMEETVPYHEELVRNVLPYGVGMFFFLGDDELERATFFSTKYDENKDKYTPAVYVEVVDVY